MRILLAEDDSSVASFIRRGLQEEHYVVDVAPDGEKALFLAQTEKYDLIILDLVLPRRSGLEILKVLRSEGEKTAVLILTARDRLEDKVEGLNLGSDDYLTKPFKFDELLARIRALLRRTGDLVPTTLQVADLKLDVLHHKATRANRELVLTSREFTILQYLMRHPNQVVTRTMLLEHVWEHDFDTFSNVVNVYLARLRKKIDDGFKEKLLVTVRGTGYMLQATEKE